MSPVLRAEAAAATDPQLESALTDRLGGGVGIKLTPAFIERVKQDVAQRRATSSSHATGRVILLPQMPEDLHAIVAYLDRHSAFAEDRFLRHLFAFTHGSRELQPSLLARKR